MSENTDLIEQYYAVRKGTFGFLERMDLSQNIDPTTWNGFQLALILRSDAKASSSILRLSFKGVRDIRIGELNGLFCYMIEIRCIEDMQIEGLTFKITESEYDAFSFACESFSFESDSEVP